MSSDLIAIFEETRKLPVEERRELAYLLLEETAEKSTDDLRKRAAHAIVEESFGSIKGVDRETLIHLAEDEEFCGY